MFFSRKSRAARLLFGTALLAVLAVAYLAWDYFPPRQIPLIPDTFCGVPCLRAKKLVVQELDREGRMWATRGFWAYSRSATEKTFTRQYHIPTGANLAWLNNFTLVRWFTSRDNCVELVNLQDGGMMAQSGPFIWLRRGPAGPWKESHKLAHYGLGIGRGSMPSGMAALPDGSLLYGEYWRNPARGPISIYRHRPTDSDWQVAYTFPDRRIRHIHAIQVDPYEPKTWVATGDGRSEPTLAWTDDDACTLHVVGRGEPSNAGQKWRICQLVFTTDALYWGADTDTSESGIYRFDRRTGDLTKLAYVPGATWFGTCLADQTVVMSSAIQAYPNEIDSVPRLWIVNSNNQVRCLPLGAYEHPPFFGSYALLRLPHNQGASDLYLTGFNIAGLNGDMLVIPPQSLSNNAALLVADAHHPPLR